MEAEFISPKDCVKYNTCKFADDSGCLDGCDFRLTKGMRMEDLLNYCKEQSAKSREEMYNHAKESINSGHNTGYCMGYAHAMEAVADMLDGKEIVKRA